MLRLWIDPYALLTTQEPPFVTKVALLLIYGHSHHQSFTYVWKFRILEREFDTCSRAAYPSVDMRPSSQD